MTYTFPHYHHVTQLWYRYGSVNGGNDCAEGTMARYLRETGFPWVGDDVSLVSHLRLYMTGQEEGPSNPYTTVEQVTAYLGMCDLPNTVLTTQEFHDWSVLLLRAVELEPAQYPFSWVGEDAVDHFILKMQDGLYNDPLASDYQDTRYTDASVRNALHGGGVTIALPKPEAVTWDAGYVAHVKVPVPGHLDAPPYPTAKPGQAYRVTTPMFLRLHPKKIGPHGVLVKAGDVLVPAHNPPAHDPEWTTNFRWCRVWSGQNHGAYGFAFARNQEVIDKP